MKFYLLFFPFLNDDYQRLFRDIFRHVSIVGKRLKFTIELVYFAERRYVPVATTPFPRESSRPFAISVYTIFVTFSCARLKPRKLRPPTRTPEIRYIPEHPTRSLLQYVNRRGEHPEIGVRVRPNSTRLLVRSGGS